MLHKKVRLILFLIFSPTVPSTSGTTAVLEPMDTYDPIDAVNPPENPVEAEIPAEAINIPAPLPEVGK